MRYVLVALLVIGVLFVAMIAFMPNEPLSREDARSLVKEITREGPPDFIAFLGRFFSPFAPSVTPEPQASGCPLFVPKSDTHYRVLRVSLAPGAEAGRLEFAAEDPREDGGPLPYILCLRATGSVLSLPQGCDVSNGAKPEGTLPIGRHGGCLSWLALGANPAPPRFD
ncbi:MULTISPECIES: hypothetical protein [unclassified Ensifer]|uniref:hypothetical protein n=1 Tax=unclassified Ensifer TaxID=2633371 RepID=UPI0030105845